MYTTLKCTLGNLEMNVKLRGNGTEHSATLCRISQLKTPSGS